MRGFARAAGRRLACFVRHHVNTIRFGSDTEYIAMSIPSACVTRGFAQANVEIAVRCFRGEIAPWVEGTDLDTFTKALRALYDSVKGEAVLSPRDQQFVLTFKCGVGGRIRIDGEASQPAQISSNLNWNLTSHTCRCPYEISRVWSRKR